MLIGQRKKVKLMIKKPIQQVIKCPVKVNLFLLLFAVHSISEQTLILGLNLHAKMRSNIYSMLLTANKETGSY